MCTKRSVSSEIARFWRELTREFDDSYRPELHYMRGPGPKWREKHRAGLRLVPPGGQPTGLQVAARVLPGRSDRPRRERRDRHKPADADANEQTTSS
jgi:hypothetical protein